MLEQDLCVLRFQGGIFVFGFQRPEIGAEFLVFDRFGGDFPAAAVGLMGRSFSFLEGCDFGVKGLLARRFGSRTGASRFGDYDLDF